jgi:hypothetical protein
VIKTELEKRFPNSPARFAADKAIDGLDAKLPMTEYIDTWYAAYVAAGGSVKVKK